MEWETHGSKLQALMKTLKETLDCHENTVQKQKSVTKNKSCAKCEKRYNNMKQHTKPTCNGNNERHRERMSRLHRHWQCTNAVWRSKTMILDHDRHRQQSIFDTNKDAKRHKQPKQTQRTRYRQRRRTFTSTRTKKHTASSWSRTKKKGSSNTRQRYMKISCAVKSINLIRVRLISGLHWVATLLLHAVHRVRDVIGAAATSALHFEGLVRGLERRGSHDLKSGAQKKHCWWGGVRWKPLPGSFEH